MNIAALDLNLLLVLRAVLEEGSTVRAAARLSVTQSAVSNALARLRVALGDPLFVRNGRGLAPTPRALELAPVVSEALAGLERALGDVFDPLTTTRTFSIAAADHHQAADLPKVAAAFAQAMPRARLRITSVDYLVASDGLPRGTVDVALAPAGSEGQGLRARPLFSESAVAVVRQGHPLLRGTITPTRLAAAGHIDVHITLGEPGDVNRATGERMASLGWERRVLVVVPSFVTAATVAAQTDHVAWLPEHAARLLTEILPLRRLRVPMPPMEVGCVLLWHERTHDDRGCAFFRELVARELCVGQTS
ncbi:MAG: LysR family transcriptional regulator [Myxococcales bacterium]|nr:LysR family transcriptional regulator [Myxococcales bacterium]